MKNYIITIIALLLLCSSSIAQQPNILLDSANNAYQNNEFDKAKYYYDSLINIGYTSSGLYYNLGNAYFKSNDIAHAIYYFEKAHKLSPSDEDILHNLTIARQMTIDKIEAVPVMFYVKWWRGITNLMSADGWAKLFVFFFIFLLCIIVLNKLIKKSVFRKTSLIIGLVVIVLMVFTFIVSVVEYKNIVNEKEAIVFDHTVNVKSSPDSESTNLFVIHEGTKVYIKDELNGWLEIRIVNGSVGWIKENKVKKL